MPIPTNITRQHIEQAMREIDKHGVPDKRKGKKYAVVSGNKTYPCKLVISLANVYANGKELDPHASNFNTYMAQDYLRVKKFKIITKYI